MFSKDCWWLMHSTQQNHVAEPSVSIQPPKGVRSAEISADVPQKGNLLRYAKTGVGKCPNVSHHPTIGE